MADTAIAPPTRLRAWRLDHGLSLDDMAALTGLSKTMLSRAERGVRNLAPLTKVKIARRLEVPLQTLFEPEESDEPETGGSL